MTRRTAIAAYLAAVALLSLVVWTTSYREALRQVAARGEADLALAADRLVNQLGLYREIAVLLAPHPVLAQLHDDPTAAAAADDLLLAAVDKTSARTAYYAARDGRVLARAPDTGAPQRGDGAPFARALRGALGSGQIGSGDERRYLYAAPAFSEDGDVLGVLTVEIDISIIEDDWHGSRPAVLFTDAEDRVFVTNRSELLGLRETPTAMIAPDGSQAPVVRREVAGLTLWDQRLSAYVPPRALHLVQDLPVIGLRAEALVDVAPAARLALLQAAASAALCLFLGALLFVLAERRRALAVANAGLERRVAERTAALETAVTALRREVAEREEAEAALKRAQADLVQAGKLSALGKMSAGISHELNQPLMAIRSFAENGAAFLDRDKPERASDNLMRISEMARRMGRIIKNLRAFAKQESVPAGRVDLIRVLQSALELTEAQLRRDDVTLRTDLPKGPIWVRGGEVRLSQVFVNLITNASEAMAASPTKEISLTLDIGAALRVTVADTGPGLTAPEQIFDPFYTTKTVGSGEGMGLGLSISYGLVQSFGGTIRGENRPDGGAAFRVELEPWPHASEGQAA